MQGASHLKHVGDTLIRIGSVMVREDNVIVGVTIAAPTSVIFKLSTAPGGEQLYFVGQRTTLTSLR